METSDWDGTSYTESLTGWRRPQDAWVSRWIQILKANATFLEYVVKLEYLDVTVLWRGVGRSTGSGEESSSMLTSVERRLLALKANKWLITTPLNFHEWTWPTTAQLFLDCHF
jgi:hypothetical protein